MAPIDKTGYEIIKRITHKNSLSVIYSNNQYIIKKVLEDELMYDEKFEEQIDWNSISKFSEEYDYIQKPFEYYFCNSYYEYKIPFINEKYSFDKLQNMIELKNNFEIVVVQKIFEMINDFLKFSVNNSNLNKKIFMHTDLKISNIFYDYENNKMFLIDLDSFKWVTIKKFYSILGKIIYNYNNVLKDFNIEKTLSLSHYSKLLSI